MPRFVPADKLVKGLGGLHGGGRSPIPKFKIGAVLAQNFSVELVDYPPTYHTFPHLHKNEQVNYVLSGDVYYFIKTNPYHMKEGDFLRIPSMEPHWAWATGTDMCRVLEIHSPPNRYEEGYKSIIVPMFDDGEEIVTTGVSANKESNWLEPEIPRATLEKMQEEAEAKIKPDYPNIRKKDTVT